MPHLTRSDRARGCLLGLAVGDALGAPLEGLSAQQIRVHYGQVDDYLDGHKARKKKPFRWRMPGLYSDDTQQALALSDVVLAHGEVDPVALSALYQRMATPKGAYAGVHRGIGRSFRKVLDDLNAGVDPARTGQASAGAGAAMRIAPLSIYYAHEPEALFDAAMAASLMTHRDIRSLAGALAVAFAARRLISGAAREPSLLYRVAADLHAAEDKIAGLWGQHVAGLDSHLHSLSTAVVRVEPILEMPREQALAALVEEANRHGAEPVCRRPTMGFAPALIPCCLYLLLTTDSLEDALIDVINLGGDADTAGAILGALAGASHGPQEIPTRWLDRLKNRAGVEARAAALDLRSTEGLSIPDLVETEAVLSKEEEAYRDGLLALSQQAEAHRAP